MKRSFRACKLLTVFEPTNDTALISSSSHIALTMSYKKEQKRWNVKDTEWKLQATDPRWINYP